MWVLRCLTPVVSAVEVLKTAKKTEEKRAFCAWERKSDRPEIVQTILIRVGYNTHGTLIIDSWRGLLERPLVEGVDAPHKRPTPLLIYLFIHLRPQNKSVNRIAPHCESYCLFPSKFSSCYKISARPGSVGVGMMANRWSWFHGDDDRAASSWEKR